MVINPHVLIPLHLSWPYQLLSSRLCKGLVFNIAICCLGTGLRVPGFMSSADHSLGRNIDQGWTWGSDLGRKSGCSLSFPWAVALPTCVILEFAYFPWKRFQLAFEVTSKIFMEDKSTLLYSKCCTYSASKCKLYLSKCVRLVLSIRAGLKIHTARKAFY